MCALTVPALANNTRHSSDATTELILQTLLTLVSSPEGAREFVAIDDASALIEIAPSQPLVLDVFLYAYSQLAVLPASSSTLRSKVNSTVQSLVVSFKGTDAVTLLGFLDSLLRRVDAEVSVKTSHESEDKSTNVWPRSFPVFRLG